MAGSMRKPKGYTLYGEVWGAQDRSKRKDRKKGKTSVKTEDGKGITFRDTGN